MHDLFICLLAMVVVVPLAKFIGLGSVVGYFIAGVMMGPHGLSLLANGTESMSELAEFGVMMMLLLIGLELNPRLLWKLRGPILGLGSIQLLGTIGIFSVLGWLLHFQGATAIAIGMIVSVSSTAIAVQSLQELGYLKSVSGEKTFAVLLFQDLAVIPLLAMIPFLKAGNEGSHSFSPYRKALVVLSALILMVMAGRLVVRPLFKMIARTKLRETFTALALLIVVAAAVLMHQVGLSPSLGAFLAGVVLADSEFRHQIEADLEPFKGLLLGLFFITIGARIELKFLLAQPKAILGWVLGIWVTKGLWNYGIGRLARLRPPESLLFAVSLASGGEFAFVLIGQSAGLFSVEQVQTLSIAIVLSMAAAPLLIKFTTHKILSRLEQVKNESREPDPVHESEKDNPVLVIGIGRFGQTFVRFLRATGYPCTVLDIDSEQIDITARFGIKSYFGDGLNVDLLRSAGLDRAKVLVIAVDEPETTTKIVESIRYQYPDLPIFARVYDRVHAYRVLHLGVTEVAIETSGSALALGTEVLKVLGMNPELAEAKSRMFYSTNQKSIRDLATRFLEEDRETFMKASKQASEQLEAVLGTDHSVQV